MKKRSFSRWPRRFAANLKTLLLYRLMGNVFGIKTSPRHKILIGTHHKTGTVWLSSIFYQICRRARLVYFSGTQADLPEVFDVFLQNHSRFAFERIPAHWRGLHVIRDPRDVIVSGCFYHQTSSESWLHRKRKDFGGLTYQEKINSYSSLEDQLLFEMDNVGAATIQEMVAWDYENPAFLEVKYEDLIDDCELFLFHRIFIHLGFQSRTLPDLLKIAYSMSLFSGNLKPTGHVRSGSSGQWRRYFTPTLKHAFAQRHGDSLLALGYEQDGAWVEEIDQSIVPCNVMGYCLPGE
ncbi:MAG: sulfotransferase domain-containing protein [Caldilineaceae bacterium]